MNKAVNLRKSFFVWTLMACLLVLSIQGQEVRVEKKDGVTIVHNPKEPVKKPGAPSSQNLIQDLCIGDSPDDENFMFSRIGGMMVDKDEDIIVIDEKEVVIQGL